MNCAKAAECISALFDGEPISREVTAHLSDCEECSARLNDYAAMGADLREIANATGTRQGIPQGQWRAAEPTTAINRLVRWKGTMRIPRFAFALMVVALLALSTGLVLTRATTTHRWFQYELFGRDGRKIMSGTAPTNPGGNPYYDFDGGMTYPDGVVWFRIRIAEQIGEAEKIAAKALWAPRGSNREAFRERLNDMPEREFLYSPGKELTIPVDGYGSLEVKGHFEAQLPANVRMGLYPEDGVFRISPPLVLVREKELLMKGDMGGGYAAIDRYYFAYGNQSEGWFLFSLKPLAGAVEGMLKMNQIEFTLAGKPYFLFTGDPIMFGSVKVWVKHYVAVQDFDPSSPAIDWKAQNGPALVFGELKHLAVEK